MKKIIFLFILCSILLISNLSIAGNTFVTEGFEGPGYENSWSEYTDSNSYIIDDSECETYAPESGDYCLEVYSDGTGNLAKSTFTLPDIVHTSEVSIRFKLSEHNLANTDVIQFANLTTNAGSKLVSLYYYYYNEVMYIAAKYLDGTRGWVYSGFYEVNEYDWNLMDFKYDANGPGFKLKINHKTVLKDTNLDDTWSINIRKLDIGICYNNGTGPAKLLISSMEWDD